MVRISTVAFATLLTAGLVGGFLGCDIDGSDDVNAAVNETFSQTTETTGTAPDTSSSQPSSSSSSSPSTSSASSSSGGGGGGGGGGFLWKPVSESTGDLVVLLPSSLTGNVAGVTISKGGTAVASGSFSGVHNGGREHFRFPVPGCGYGSGLTVTARLRSGGSRSWAVPNGCGRVE